MNTLFVTFIIMGLSFVGTHQAFKIKKGQRLFTNSGHAPMGWGLPAAIGAYFATKDSRSKSKIICLVGDQELIEGTTWESLHIINNYKIKNILLIIDRNNSDFRSIKFLQLKKKLSVFCDKISEVDGHNIKALSSRIDKAIKNKKSFEILIFIPARSKSKRFKNKNLKKINGVSLIEKTINFSKKIKQKKYIYLSTDSQKYANIAAKKGAHVPFLRSSKNSLDQSDINDAINEFLKKTSHYLKFKYLNSYNLTNLF